MSVIALDARKYFDFGIGTYIQHLIREYASMQPTHDFLLFIAPEEATTIVVPERWKTSVVPYGKYSLGEMFLLGRKVKANNVSVFHSPHYTLPFGLTSPSVVTIHDLIHLRFPQFFSPVQRAYSFGMIRHAIGAARFIITDTEFTKQDILRSFRAAEQKIIPIHLGVSEQFRQKNNPAEAEGFKVKFRLERPYILFVGNTKPHKGLHILLRAFKEVLEVASDIDLVFVGGPVSGNEDLQRLISSFDLAGKVRSLGRLPDGELVLAYGGAEMLVLPSLYEGFGLPALEAMACGIPVIVSDAASLPEIVGDAAIICGTGKPDAFADAMMSLLRDSHLKADMIKRGLKHASTFSWKVTAQKTMDVYNRIA
jgi:glycosyltransferase involved in cell wall biosynthesis